MINNFISYVKQVRQEFLKITWSTRKQATSITGIVFLMVTIFSLFFFSLDAIFSIVVNFLLNLG